MYSGFSSFLSLWVFSSKERPEYMAKENETLVTFPTTYVYALSYNNRGVFCVGWYFTVRQGSFIIFVLTEALVHAF